jgi:hypothetical protein
MKNKNLVALWNMLMMVLFVLCMGLFGMLAVVSIFILVPKFLLQVTGETSVDFTYWFFCSIFVMGVISIMNNYVCKFIAARLTDKIKSRGQI